MFWVLAATSDTINSKKYNIYTSIKQATSKLVHAFLHFLLKTKIQDLCLYSSDYNNICTITIPIIAYSLGKAGYEVKR